MTTPKPLLAALFLSLTLLCSGQASLPTSTPQLPLAAPPAPLLKIEDADPAAAKAVGLESLTIAATLAGPLAQTTITMTFRNSLARQLEGELEFPLPQGASVVGYALDVPAGSGILVDGVAIEKERARQIFESEERRGVDPGILEQTRGNNYRTRVHPIPAGGTRTIQLTFVSDLLAVTTGEGRLENLNKIPNVSIYSLPIDFVGTLKSAKIHLDVLGTTDPKSAAVSGLPNLAFTPGDNRITADKSFANIALSGTLSISQPITAATYTAVEPRLRPTFVDNLSAPPVTDNYFFLSANINPVINAEVVRPGTIALLWDTNLSRASTDKSAEIAAVRALLTQLKNVHVQLLTTTDPTPHDFPITNGNSDALITAINALTYDGALRIDQLLLAGTMDTRSDSQPRTVRADLTLFVTNGLVTLGENRFAQFSGSHAPVYTLSADPQADHALLQRLAEETGGLYLNLQRLKPDQAAATILQPRLVASFSWEQNKPLIDEVYPTGAFPIVPGQPIHFYGRLLAPEATVTLSYGIPGGNQQTQTIKLTRADSAPASGIIPRFWAQQKAAALAADEKNADQLLALAKDFTLVTPNTSLLVLETVDQYLRYRVVPPKSRPEIYQQFAQRIEQEGKQADAVKQQKIDHILALWKDRTDWWNTTFAVPSQDALARAAATQNSSSGGEPGAASDRITGSGGTGGAARGGAFGGGGMGGGGFGNGSGGLFTGPSTAPATPSTPASTRPVENIQAPRINLGSVAGQPSDQRQLQQLSASYAMRDVAGKVDATTAAAAIAIRAWSPDTPYLRALTAAKPDAAYSVYLAQRKDFLASPSFYLDCANFFFEHNQRDLGVRLLTNIAQLRLENAPLLRVAAYRLLQIGQYNLAIDLFEKAKALRPDEPQSWRDLAQALAARAETFLKDPKSYQAAFADWQRALDLYTHVIMNQWERFDEIELIALMEENAVWQRIRNAHFVEDPTGPTFANAPKNPLDSRLIKNLDCDVRIVMTWDADDTDIDLHVIEPTGQEAYYAYNRTLAGGLVSKDFTQGYGPEEYLIHHALPGTYKIAANYFGSQQQSLQGPVTVQATVITHFGRPDEKRQSMTLRLTDQKETVPIGSIVIGK